MTERTILGIDPGGTTGLVLLEWNGDLPARADTSPVLWHAQLPGEGDEGAEDVIYDLLRSNEVTHVAIERFTIGPGTAKLTRTYDALYLNGLVRFLARRYGVAYQLQTPAHAKKPYADTRLSDLGYWLPGDHERDAMRHALLSTHT